MTIASEITRINNNIASAYTAVNNKGGTLPATQNSANLATAINSISGGGSGYTELPSYQVSNGVASKRSGALTGNEFSNITSVGNYGLYFAFYEHSGLTGTLNLSSLTSVGNYGFYSAFDGCTGLTSVDLSSLTSVGDNGLYFAFRRCTGLRGSLDLSSLTSVGSSGFYNAFDGCTGLTSVDLSSLTSVGGFYGAFDGCTGLTSVDLSALTSIGDYGLRYAFNGCTRLTSVYFPALTSISTYGLYNAFQGCTGLRDVYFNSLTTTSFGSYKDQFGGMLSGTGKIVTHTLHFPSNLQTTISGLTGYPRFGGTSGYVTLAFDLPATS